MSNNADGSKPALHPLDAMTAAPEHHEVLMENERVRVLDTRVRPGERTPVHAHEWPATLFVLGWSDFVRYDQDGKILLDSRTTTSMPKKGAAVWGPPLPPHSVHNVGDGELHVIAIELKG